jgi:hypothetical protein
LGGLRPKNRNHSDTLCAASLGDIWIITSTTAMVMKEMAHPMIASSRFGMNNDLQLSG